MAVENSVGDLISREAAIEMLKEKLNRNYTPSFTAGDAFASALHRIKNLPSIDAVPVVHGRWIDGRGSWSTSNCSVCGWKIPYSEDAYLGYTKYCPNCGAKMDK